jgi:hypothetical protein
MPNIKRYVIGPDQDGRSTVLETEPTNTQTKAGFYSRSTLWATQETPVNNTIEGDRALTEGLGARREPFPGGMLVRALELWPDTDPDEQRKEFAQLNAEVQQKHLPTAADAQRHPTMHRTDTLDCITVVRGEICRPLLQRHAASRFSRPHGHHPRPGGRRRRSRHPQVLHRNAPAQVSRCLRHRESGAVLRHRHPEASRRPIRRTLGVR